MLVDSAAVQPSGHVVLRKDKEAALARKAQAISTAQEIVAALKLALDRNGQPIFIRASYITGENGWPDHFVARSVDGYDLTINYAGGSIVSKNGEAISPGLGQIGRIEWLKKVAAEVLRANYSAGGI